MAENIKDDRLEILSDKVRGGIPIGFGEALEVIEYQELLKKQKKGNSFRGIIKNWWEFRKHKKKDESITITIIIKG